jgi:hypothetical protein
MDILVQKRNRSSSISTLQSENYIEEKEYNIGKWARTEHINFINSLLKHGSNMEKLIEYVKTRKRKQIGIHLKTFLSKFKENSKENTGINEDPIVEFVKKSKVAALEFENQKEKHMRNFKNLILNEKSFAEIEEFVYKKHNFMENFKMFMERINFGVIKTEVKEKEEIIKCLLEDKDFVKAFPFVIRLSSL